MNYLICTTPRSGSNLLCSFLMNTGEAGLPREYLCPAQIGEHGPSTSGLSSIEGHPARFQRYYDGVRAAYSSGGRFGVKAHLHQLLWAVERDFDFEANMPHRFVHLARADVLGQAISFVRASQTGAFVSGTAERQEPFFDADSITKAIRFMKHQEAKWEEIFAACGVEPYRMAYETFVADMEGELSGLLRFLDIDPSRLDLARIIEGSTQSHRKQRDGISSEWRDRYREILREQAEAKTAALS